MLINRPTVILALIALMGCAAFSSNAFAETVIKFDLADFSAGPDVSFAVNSLSTADDGDASTMGDQSTDVKYQGFLSNLSPISSGASLTISGIAADGDASLSMGGLITQVTTGGMFSLYDNMNKLLLAGNFGGGLIAGSTVSTSGGFFSTSPILYTDGSLFPLVQADSGRISLSFTDVRSNGTPGLSVGVDGKLQNFSATATGSLEASAVPEPSVIGMAAIGAVAMLCHRHRRRRSAKTA